MKEENGWKKIGQGCPKSTHPGRGITTPERGVSCALCPGTADADMTIKYVCFDVIF